MTTGLWIHDVMARILNREQFDAVRRLEDEHYGRHQLSAPCDGCRVFEAIFELCSEIEETNDRAERREIF